jgi:Tfp pilus assembly protein PilV
MSIQRIHDHLSAGRTAAQDDAGLSMTEVITALFVFTIFILGLGYSLLSMTRLVGDSENRQVAASLAAQEIDIVRAIPDAFDVLSKTSTQTVGNTTFTIKRVAGWVTTNGSTASCGTGGGNLQDKAVDVQVTWQNQYVLVSPIRSTTILAPSTRINDPSFGTIIVSTLGADGKGRSAVTVSVVATAGGGGTTPTSVDPTDSSGCSYVLKVAPGTYTVSVSKTSYLDSAGPLQVASPSRTVTVPAGGSQIATFQYDQRATFNMQYASNYTGPGTVKLPSSLATSFMNSAGLAKSATTAASTQYLFPFSEGYSAIAGNYVDSSITPGCLSIDPLQWAAGTANGVPMAAGTRPAVGVTPGGSGTLGVPMGVIQTTWPLIADSITVQSVTPPAGLGDPGCASPTTYTYSFATIPAPGTTIYLAVPFGSWQVYSSFGAIRTVLPAATVTVATQGEVTAGIATLDPRIPS